MNLILLKQSESIETLWNVNVIYWCHCSAVPRIESIETLWNVNRFKLFLGVLSCLGINRNIVECKFSFALTSKDNLSESIETLWNVNMQSSKKLQTASGINRNIVECKYG